MKILVCIAHVPDTTSKISFTNQNTSLETTGMKFIINPNDEYGLTKAIEFKEKLGAEVTVLNVGELETEATLRKALAIGADKAIRINTPAKNGIFVAKQIAHFSKQKQYDLIFTGRESIDYNGNVVPGVLARLLGYSFANFCVGLEVENNIAIATREMEKGKESIAIELPLVIAAQKGLVEIQDLKIPNMRGIISARQKKLTVLDPVEVILNSSHINFKKKQAQSSIKMISVQELADILHNELKII